MVNGMANGMGFQDLKLYSHCVMRLKHQSALLKERGRMGNGSAVLESFRTAEVEEIVDPLELYDLKAHMDISCHGFSAMPEELETSGVLTT